MMCLAYTVTPCVLQARAPKHGVLKEKMFYIKPVPQNVAGDRTVDKFGGVSLKWRAAGGAGPAFEQAKLLAEWG